MRLDDEALYREVALYASAVVCISERSQWIDQHMYVIA